MSGSGLSRLSARRHTLVTAAVAGALLCLLWFVPSANATQDAPKEPHRMSEHQPTRGNP